MKKNNQCKISISLEKINLMEVNGMGQIANQMLIEAIFKMKEKLKNKKTEKENEKKGKDRK